MYPCDGGIIKAEKIVSEQGLFAHIFRYLFNDTFNDTYIYDKVEKIRY